MRELAISLYLLLFKFIFTLCRLFPLERKTTFISSFGDNVLYTVKELERMHSKEKIFILKTPSCREDFSETSATTILFTFTSFIQFVRGIYHIATSRVIMADNYFGFLAVTDLKDEVDCVQLWHAAGALKKFGLMDPSINSRTKNARERFRTVYSRFTHVVVGSEKMTSIFKRSFGISDDKFIRSGIPRTDFFYQLPVLSKYEKELAAQFPIIKQKKVILYAPTFRDGDLINPKIHLDLARMYQELGQEYVLFMRLHPAVKLDTANLFPNFVYDVSHYKNINPLLTISDILITDYSSIPFEYSLLNKPMIFYTYDLEEYMQIRGVEDSYIAELPGPIVKNTNSLIKTIKFHQYDMNKVNAFSRNWNTYSKGNASNQLVSILYEKEQSQRANVSFQLNEG
ncbi:CDP-glycerol glycerophosphotransferase family protein [Terribacillus saccharophilus]|uniref:CDP-glycerol glycerophosphotransferase family protein n=1 Tax=Terribacillus saccharophilus TaxID=361277 RepID=UPI002DC439C4|nr:CDP-glycerol glycerophosphotransferase family protein [Terribacillus saccharophilus]MEC0291207.1 CDP-glycerol glycerophosphotransferase family protein [Terribacillus saccharophilus]